MHKATRAVLINGTKYQRGEIVPDAEQLQRFRRLLSTKVLERVSAPAPSPVESPVESIPELEETVELAPTQEPAPAEEVKVDDLDVQRQPSEQPVGRNQVRDRGHELKQPSPAGRGSAVRVVTRTK